MPALSAKAFGFPRAIAHGMWTLARAASALQPPKPLAEATLSAEFKLPLLLPGEASLWSASPSLIERDIEVRDIAGEKPHLRGGIKAAGIRCCIRMSHSPIADRRSANGGIGSTVRITR